VFEVVQSQRARDPVERARIQWEWFGEVGYEVAATVSASLPGLLHHQRAEVDPYDVCALVKQPLALGAGATPGVQHGRSGERTRDKGTQCGALEVAIEGTVVGRRGPDSAEPVIGIARPARVLSLITR
jgi:hypothetical protein